MCAEKSSDSGWQCQPEQYAGMRKLLPAGACQSGDGVQHDESRRDAAGGFWFYPAESIKDGAEEDTSADTGQAGKKSQPAAGQ